MDRERLFRSFDRSNDRFAAFAYYLIGSMLTAGSLLTVVRDGLWSLAPRTVLTAAGLGIYGKGRWDRRGKPIPFEMQRSDVVGGLVFAAGLVWVRGGQLVLDSGVPAPP